MKFKVGDLVKPSRKNLLSGKRNVGIVMETGTGWDSKQVLVLWEIPLWTDVDGLSSEMPDNLEVINESR